jgi:DNA-binding LacI/PurR family transcriptional regulator
MRDPHVTRRRATSADVAREAGVSRATVSYVLNGTATQTIPEATRARVRDAADRLGYVASAAGRALRLGRSRIVLMLVPDYPLPAAAEQGLRAMTRFLEARGLVLVIHHQTSAGGEASRRLWASIDPALVIVFDQMAGEPLAALRSSGVDHIVALTGRAGPDAEDLQIDESRIGRVQVEHLLACGHRRLAYAYSSNERQRAFADLRLRGARETCRARSVDEPVPVVVPQDAIGAAAVLRGLVADGLTGVCAYDDDVALAILAGAREAGIGVPSALAVVGVDDIPAAALAVPPLTTVAVDYTDIAEFVAEGVASLVLGAPAPVVRDTGRIRLVPRATTGQPRTNETLISAN